MTDLGRAIKFCRIERGLTQVELAEATSLSVSYISLLECNKRNPQFSVVEKLAKAFGIPLALFAFAIESDDNRIDIVVREKLSYMLIMKLRKNKEV